MQKNVFGYLAGFAIFFSQWVNVLCADKGEPCVNNRCPEVTVLKEAKDVRLPGIWECAVCGSESPESSPSCELWFRPFSKKPSGKGCEVKQIDAFCESNECEEKNTKMCISIFFENYCCVCNDNYFGLFCQLPPVIDYVSTVKFDKKPMKIDLRNRPTCWKAFDHHSLNWKSKLYSSRVIVAYNPVENRLPWTVSLINHVYRSFFTKYTTKVSKSEYENWCRSSTNLGVYCGRLGAMFEPSLSENRKFNHRFVILHDALLPFADTIPSGGWENSNLWYWHAYPIGYSVKWGLRVFPLLLEAPYWRYRNLVTSNRMLTYDDRSGFTNYSGVDRLCIPVITQQCNTQHIKSRFYPHMKLSFSMVYDQPPPECQETEIKHWQMFKQGLNMAYTGGEEIVTREGCCTLSLSPYTLRTGIYLVKLTIMHIFNNEKTYNSKYCIAPIYNDKIKAKFKEFTKTVNAEDFNKVEVEALDINNPPGDQKKDLVFTWSCQSKSLDNRLWKNCPMDDLLKNSPFIEIPPKRLLETETYFFKVKVDSTAHLHGVKDDTSAEASQTLVVVKLKHLITLICATCDSSSIIDPDEYNIFYIRAKDGVSLPHPTNYKWSFAEEKEGTLSEFQSVEDIREETHNIVLKIKKHVLESGQAYVFQAQSEENSKVFAQVRVVASPLKFWGDLNCSLNPFEGIRGWTDFTVVCAFEDETLFFEFYDKDENEKHYIYGGRMLGYNSYGVLSNFKMTNKLFFVVAFDSNMARKNYTAIVQLTPYNDKLQYLEGLLGRAQESTKMNQFNLPSATVSSVATVMEKNMNPSGETIKQPVLILRTVNLSYMLGLLKLVLSSLKIVLTNTAEKFDVFKDDPYLVKSATDTLYIISLNLIIHEGNIAQEPTLTHTVYYDMVKAVFDCAEIILEQKNRQYRSKPEEHVLPFISDLVQTISFTIVSALETISYSLNRMQIPGDNANDVVSENERLLAKTKVDFIWLLSNWTTNTTNEKNCSVLISGKVISSMNTSRLLGMQYIRMKTNPFWWAGGNIVSEVLLVNVCQREELIECRKLTRFQGFVALSLKVVEPLNFLLPIKGTAYQVDPKTTDEFKELDLSVYRFFLPERAKLFLKFLLEGTQEYRIVLREGFRPDYTELVKNPYVINVSSPDFLVPYDNKHPNEKVYYMGILPSSNVSIGERIPFRLKAYYTLCNTWVKWQWTSFGCFVGVKSNEESINCDCDHLSVVAGSITIPDHNLSTVSEFMLYLTPWENLLPLFIALTILLFYLLLMIWAVVKDRGDIRRGEAIVLEDNFPGERYGYLLGVYTGSRLFASTTANVGVRLYGEMMDSRAHILRSPDRGNVFTSISETWFLLYNRRHLGKLRGLHMWHDDKGLTPDWFVDKIEVYDLKTHVKYIFEINTWIAMEVSKFPEVFVTPIEIDKYFHPLRIFMRHFVNGLRDTHNWTSVCLKHPRNPVSRVERISVILCLVLSAMATCLLLYLLHFGFYIDEDKPSYYLDFTDLIIFIIALIIVSIVTYLVMGLLRKSLTHKYKSGTIRMSSSIENDESPEEPQAIRSLRNVQVYTTNIQENVNDGRNVTFSSYFQKFGFLMKQHQKRTMCEKCVMAMYKIAHGNSHLPVRLAGTKSDLIVLRRYFIPAWVLCIVVILMSLLIVLLYAWKLPTIKGRKFLATFFAVVVFNALILSFFKNLIFAALLSYIFYNILPETTYHIRKKDGMRLHLYGDMDFVANLLRLRKQKIYYPLNEHIKEYKRLRKLRIFRWRVLIEFLMIAILVCVISITCKMYYVNRYTSNAHATHLMTTGDSIRVPDLPHVFNRTDLYDFLEITFVSRLFKFLWYNYKPLMNLEAGRLDWTGDFTSRLLGSVRIRQLRVSLANCKVSGHFHDFIKFCARSWERGPEDKIEYATSWLLADYKDIERKITTWRYTEKEISNSSRFYGESGTLYHGGGYIAALGYSKKKVRGLLLTLEAEEWLDHMTRVVFTELTLYNVNTNLFTQVVLVSEQQPTGQYISIPKVESVILNIGFDFWNIGFIIFQVFFLFRALYFLNRHGLIEHLSDYLNSYDIFLLILGFTTVAFYIVHVKYSSHYVDEYRRRGMNSFFSFFEIVRYDFMSKAMMCFLFLCVVVKLILSWRFGRIFLTFYYTFLLSLLWIIWSTVYFTVYITILWRFVGYKLNAYIFSHYSSAVVFPKDYKITGVHENMLGHLVVYVMCISSSFVNLLFIASFAHFYRVAKYYKIVSGGWNYDFNGAEFFIRELKRLWKKHKN